MHIAVVMSPIFEYLKAQLMCKLDFCQANIFSHNFPTYLSTRYDLLKTTLRFRPTEKDSVFPYRNLFLVVWEIKCSGFIFGMRDLPFEDLVLVTSVSLLPFHRDPLGRK